MIIDILIVPLVVYLVHLTVAEILALVLFWLAVGMLGPRHAGRLDQFLEGKLFEVGSGWNVARLASAYAASLAFVLICDSFIKRPPRDLLYATYFRHAVCLVAIGSAGIGIFSWPRRQVSLPPLE